MKFWKQWWGEFAEEVDASSFLLGLQVGIVILVLVVVLMLRGR